MNREDILKSLQELFVDLLDDEEVVITEDTKRSDIADWDSLFHMTLMASVGSEFGIELSTDDIVHTASIKDIIDLVEGK